MLSIYNENLTAYENPELFEKIKLHASSLIDLDPKTYILPLVIEAVTQYDNSCIFIVKDVNGKTQFSPGRTNAIVFETIEEANKHIEEKLLLMYGNKYSFKLWSREALPSKKS